MLRFPRAPLIWLLLPLLAGYAVAEFAGAPLPIVSAGVLGFAIVGLLACFGSSRKSVVLWKISAWTAGCCLAAGLYQFRAAAPDREGLPPREALLTIQTERLFASSHTGGRVQGLARVREAERHLADLVGQRIYFSMPRSVEDGPWPRATRIRVRGVLEPVRADGTSSFATFLRRSGVRFQLIRVELLDDNPDFRRLTQFAFQTSQRFEEFLRRGNEGDFPLANIYVAMLLGKRAELSDAQREAFLFTGTLHLFAISGLHVGVIALAIHSLLTLFRLPRRASAVIGLSLLYLFVEITGASPSAVRAYLMVFFFWGAHFVARSPNPVSALTASAAFVLILFPYQLWSPGFQLSYSVVAGILLLGLPLGSFWVDKYEPFQYIPEALLSRPQKWLAKAVRGSIRTFAVSLSATLLSSPLTIFYFGVFTPGAVFLNLLLIPMAGLVLTAGFLSIVLSLAGVPFMPEVFNHSAWMTIAAMNAVVLVAPYVPGLFWQAEFRAGWLGIACLAALLVTLLAGFHRRWRPAPALCIAPFAVLVLFVMTTVRLTFLPK